MSIETKLAFPGSVKRMLITVRCLGFQANSLADLYVLCDLPVTSSRNSTASSRLSPAQSIGQSLATTVIFEQQNEDDSLPESNISPPHSAQLLGFSERSNSQTGLLGMGMAAAKNRGRRVSFGGIKAIPQNFNSQHKEFHFELDGGNFVCKLIVPFSCMSKTDQSQEEQPYRCCRFSWKSVTR